ncbi:MAG TPA: glycosyltransferase family 39 protein [Micromonosporaceae bacterium]
MFTSTAPAATVDGARSRPAVPPVAWWPVGTALVATLVVLTVTSFGYGYHRDELYFRMLPPAWGYLDQPPLTPVLARVATGLFGDHLWAVRVPATLCAAGAVLLVALIARELGGRGWAQGIAAFGFASASGTLIFGHILLTATVDLLLWSAVILFAVRALLRAEPRWWLAVGAAVGVALDNKDLVVLLLLGLAVGLLLVGPRRVLTSGWLWAGVGLAVLIGAPNLLYQATHGWPQATMAGAIAVHKGPDARPMVLPLQILLIGPPLFALVVVGFVALLRRPTSRAIRAFAVGYLVVVVVVLVTGGQGYYPYGLLGLLLAAGAVPTERWLTGHGGRRALLVAAIGVNAAVSTVIALPVVPLSVLGDTPVPAVNQAARDQVGWPVYVGQVAAAYRALPPADRAHAVVLTANYGEAGAISRYGAGLGLPAVYSGHNQLYAYGPPPADTTVVVTVGLPMAVVRDRFGDCQAVGRLDNGVRVDNEEQGRPIAICRNPVAAWARLWPSFRHFD